MLEVKLYRGRWYVCAGVSRLSQGYAQRDDATADLADNKELYTYWAGSAGVSIENKPAKVVKLEG